MVSPMLRYAIKLTPVAIEVARQLDRQLRPHLLAYRRAREVDGYVGRWTGASTTHWLVFPRRNAEPVAAFPTLELRELDLAHREIARAALKHHAEMPEARATEKARAVAAAPKRAASAASNLVSRDQPSRRPRRAQG